MVPAKGGLPSLGVDFLLPNFEFPLLPSTLPSKSKTNSIVTSIMTKEKTFADTLNDNEILEDSMLMKITHIEKHQCGRYSTRKMDRAGIIGKFSYEWRDLEELRRIIPQQYYLKGDCQIGLLWSKHILY
ncbi:hypothetical protein H5410_005103 [Solanum commersonii]|uniref:Uncharacterized protein n=1 Tax=Solanum commersonii TaxID=4109 RepID=A0A9J6A5Q3_SOLCO|nr:hypothetical protein H5410_005103 [Solanum commersonii]